ncbi:MAG: hypothetical protein HY258_02125 [Chloroflexi bacterium]|nr:hypothetical protein [Chloroflexota bacterium]
MTAPNDKSKKSPADRFHNIISAARNQQPKKDNVAETKKSPIMNLPQAGSLTGTSGGGTSSPSPSGPQTGLRLRREQLLPAFWTVASIMSVVINVILLVILVTVLRGLGSVNATGVGSGLLGGLYTNFERMDQAHIRTVIPVQADVPLNMNIPVQTVTGITLAQDVVIHNARVKITTPTFNIDSPADVTLPAGTSLNVAMNFSVPVQAQVPITLNVPVDIAIQNTELHPAITGLQATIKPLYCIMAPTALSLSGAPVCR